MPVPPSQSIPRVNQVVAQFIGVGFTPPIPLHVNQSMVQCIGPGVVSAINVNQSMVQVIGALVNTAKVNQSMVQVIGTAFAYHVNQAAIQVISSAVTYKVNQSMIQVIGHS